jgi:hypothetical protein
MADAHETLGQHVQQKAPDEFAGFEREDLAPIAVGAVIVTEDDSTPSMRAGPLSGTATRQV